VPGRARAKSTGGFATLSWDPGSARSAHTAPMSRSPLARAWEIPGPTVSAFQTSRACKRPSEPLRSDQKRSLSKNSRWDRITATACLTTNGA
jgi:hypothetical protein